MSKDSLPALSGAELISLLISKDGWTEHGRRTHGVALRKKVGDRTLATIIPNKTDSLPKKTLGAILGPLQTKIGRKGLVEILNRK